jgi:tetratricopeptide (TPR) repeat protein
LELWEQVPDPGQAAGLDRVELLTRAAEAAGASGRTHQSLELLTTALDQVDPADDPVRVALLHMRLGGQRWGAGDEPACLAALEEAVRILPAEPSPERARVLAYYAQYLMLADRWHEAARCAKEALAVARTVGARAEEGHALDILGVCTRDVERLLAARRIAQEIGNAEGIVRAYLNLGATLSTGGRQREALDVFRRGFATARELGLERAMGSVLAVALAATLFEVGDWEESGRVVAEALERGGVVPFRLHWVKGMLDLGRGDFSTAREQLELAVGLSPSLIEASWPLTWLAELAIWEGRYDDARAAVDQAVNRLQPLDPEEELPPTETALIPALGLRVEAEYGELARAARSAAGVLEGRPDPQLWQRAAETWERLEAAYPAAYARFRQAEALLAARAPRARIQAVIRAGHQTVVRLGAGPLWREIELLARRGRLRLEEHVAAVAAPEPPASAAPWFGLTRREAEVLVAVAAPTGRSARNCSSPPRPPASTSRGFWPSWGSPVAVRRPRSPTGSASTSDDPGGRGRSSSAW